MSRVNTALTKTEELESYAVDVLQPVNLERISGLTFVYLGMGAYSCRQTLLLFHLEYLETLDQRGVSSKCMSIQDPNLCGRENKPHKQRTATVTTWFSV